MPSVVVVGASRGIGREFVAQYLADGWSVAATARGSADVAALAAAGAAAYAVDTTDEASLAALAAAAPGPHDLLVLNAGINVREGGLKSVDAAKWRELMTVNALGPLLAARALVGTLREGGTIAALSSSLGSIGANSGGGLYSYRMSKAALNAGLKTLAIELKPRRIAVAALHPGWVKTEMGGDGAEVAVPDSVAGLRRVIAGLTPARSGAFLDYRGNSLPW